MAITVTHRHVHVPWTPIIAALVTAAIAVVVIVALNYEPVSTTTQTEIGAPSTFRAAAVPKPETPALRRLISEGAYPAAPSAPPFTSPRHFIEGTVLGGTDWVSPPMPDYPHSPYGSASDPYPFNHFPGKP